jgi:hypothetical protein
MKLFPSHVTLQTYHIRYQVKGKRTVKSSGNQLEPKIVEHLNRCLEGIPFVEGLKVLGKSDLDAAPPGLLAEVQLSQGTQLIIVDINAIGQPRFARGAVNELLRLLRDRPEAYGVFAAPYVSPRAAAICARERIGYVDLAGNCRLSFGKVFIERTGNPNPFTERRELRSLFSPKATRILRLLLSHPRTEWRMQALAHEAHVSIGLVSKVKSLLANREWLMQEERGMRLADPETVLMQWAENYTYRKNEVRNFYSLRTIPEVEAHIAEKLSEEGVRYALTGFSGADRMAPFVRYSRMMAYVDETERDVTELLNLKKVTSGPNVTLLIPYDEGVYYDTREINGIRVASPIQVFLDLVADRGRGEDAAKELMERVIRPSWRASRYMQSKQHDEYSSKSSRC